MAGAGGLSREAVVNRVTNRAWWDEPFRVLLFESPQAALVSEFGSVPAGFENAVFRPREIDRAVVRRSADGRHLKVRPKRGEEPLSVVVREVFGVRELVVVLYTRRCRYQCSFCTLPLTSAYVDVPFRDVKAQIARAIEFACAEETRLGQVSLGNEGSILDERTFPREQLEYVTRISAGLPGVESVVLETRSEFVMEPLLDDLLAWVSPARLTLKIGLESADEHVRNRILRKRMDLRQFESVVRLLGRKEIALATYVLVKADPTHSDAAGTADAIATCEYLKGLCREAGTPLTLRVNAMYRAANSAWALWAEREGWVPPSIFDLASVMRTVLDDDVRVYAGLSEEGLATADGHFEARDDFERWALTALEQYNRTGDVELLDSVAARARRPSETAR
jgi:archaeosine synthase beta-subunit